MRARKTDCRVNTPPRPSLNVAMLVIDDMNKEGIKGTVKGKASLAGSARKLHDADEIIILRSSSELPDVVLLTWEKNREGANVGCISLLKSRKYPFFGNMAITRKAEERTPALRRDVE